MDEQIHQMNQEELDEFQRQLDDFSIKVHEAHLARFQNVSTSINTEQFDGLTLGELRSEFSTKILNHANNKTVNIHQINPQQLILT